MPFYFLAVNPWVQGMNKKVACIEIAGKNGNLMDLSDVRNVNDLMNKKALPIRNITFRYAKDAANVRGSFVSNEEIMADETLGETLERWKREREVKTKAKVGLTSSNRQRRSSLGHPKKELQACPQRRSSSLSFCSSTSLASGDDHELVHVPEQALANKQDHDHRDETEQEEGSVFEESAMQLSDDDDGSMGIDEDEEDELELLPENEMKSHGEKIFYTSEESNVTEATILTSESRASQLDDASVEAEHPPPALKSCMKVKSLEDSLARCPYLPGLADTGKPSRDSTPSAPCRRVSHSSVSSSEERFCWSGRSVRRSGRLSMDVDEAFRIPYKSPLSVNWGHVEIRQYSICLGDNPACAKGAPIQLDWTYRTKEIMWVEKFELCRELKPRVLRVLSANRRKQLLLNYGYTQEQLNSAIQVKARDQKRRVKTISRLKYIDFDAQVERIVRIFPGVSA